MRALCAMAAASLACAAAQPSGAHRLACGAGLTAASRASPRGIDSWCEDDRGVRAGAFERHFPRGQLAERGSYAAGLLDGDYASFYANGSPHERGRYTRGQRDGAWRAWHENGKPWLEVHYAAGQLDGAWLEHDFAGARMFEGTYRNGQLEGPWRGFQRNGGSITGHSAAGKLEGVAVDRDPGGKTSETSYRNNRQHGAEITTDKDGKVTRAEYVDGIKQDNRAP